MAIPTKVLKYRYMLSSTAACLLLSLEYMPVNRSSEKPLQPGENNALPFCSHSGLPDFPAIQTDGVLSLMESLVAGYRSGVEQRLAQESAPDWSFVEAEIEWADAIERAWSPISHLNAVADGPYLREVYNRGLDLLTSHQTWRSQQRQNAIHSYARKVGQPAVRTKRHRVFLARSQGLFT